MRPFDRLRPAAPGVPNLVERRLLPAWVGRMLALIGVAALAVAALAWQRAADRALEAQARLDAARLLVVERGRTAATGPRTPVAAATPSPAEASPGRASASARAGGPAAGVPARDDVLQLARWLETDWGRRLGDLEAAVRASGTGPRDRIDLAFLRIDGLRGSVEIRAETQRLESYESLRAALIRRGATRVDLMRVEPPPADSPGRRAAFVALVDWGAAP